MVTGAGSRPNAPKRMAVPMAKCENCGAYYYGKHKCRNCGGKLLKVERQWKPLVRQKQLDEKKEITP